MISPFSLLPLTRHGCTALLFIVSFAMFAGCSEKYDSGYRDYYKDNYYTDAGPGVPPEELPRTGRCRIWYPDVPPARQPSSGDCTKLRSEVPPGAWLVYGPGLRGEDYQVDVFHPKRPGVVWEIRWYDADNGALIHVKGREGGGSYHNPRYNLGKWKNWKKTQ